MQPESCWIWLSPSNQVLFFQRRPGPHCAKPAWIQSGWPGQVSAKRILSRSKPVCHNHQAWLWQNATGLLPVSHFQTQLCSSTWHIWPGSYCAKPAWTWFSSGQLCHIFGQMDPVRRQTGVQESYGLLLTNTSRSRWDVNRIWHVYWDCTTHCSLMIFVRHVSINFCMRSSPLSCISRPTCCSCKWTTTATTAQVSTILNDSAHPLYSDSGNSWMERSGRLNGKN